MSPPVAAPLYDAARALQHLRYHAQELGLDGDRIAVTGGSAGGATTCWLAMRDDLSDPDDPDPIARESTRGTSAQLAAKYISQWKQFQDAAAAVAAVRQAVPPRIAGPDGGPLPENLLYRRYAGPDGAVIDVCSPQRMTVLSEESGDHVEFYPPETAACRRPMKYARTDPASVPDTTPV
jgi:hypothetical protein